MSKEGLLGLGMIGMSFMCIGTLIGGIIVNKYNKKQDDLRCEIYKKAMTILKDQMIRDMVKNENLKSKSNSKEA